jgi:hypothetical protein
MKIRQRAATLGLAATMTLVPILTFAQQIDRQRIQQAMRAALPAAECEPGQAIDKCIDSKRQILTQSVHGSGYGASVLLVNWVGSETPTEQDARVLAKDFGPLVEAYGFKDGAGSIEEALRGCITKNVKPAVFSKIQGLILKGGCVRGSGGLSILIEKTF